LVDDDDVIRAFLRSTLERSGFVVHEASSGETALGMAEKPAAPIGLLITDVNMPGMDGVSLAREITQLIPGIPVLFISGLASREGATTSGPHAFLAKPFTPKQLAEAIDRLTGHKAAGNSSGDD